MLHQKDRQLVLFEQNVGVWGFLKALARCSFSKSVLLVTFVLHSLFFIQEILAALKFQVIRRLIWGGGRLGQPIAHAGILALAVTIFMVGGMFSGSSVVRGATVETLLIASLQQDLLSAETPVQTREPENRPRDEVFEYEVEVGDTLSTIGEKFQVTVETLRYANDLSDVDSLAVGKKLVILPVSGVRHQVKSGDTVESIAEKYKVSPQAVIDFNYLNEPFALNIGDSLTVPEATIPRPVPAEPPVALAEGGAPLRQGFGGTSGTGAFRWPTDSQQITQYFSYWHPAIDIGQYSSIYASDAGTVVFAGWSPVGYGYLIEVDHGNGYRTGYAHLSRIDVSVGQTVGKGQAIGLMGATGRAWGVHLHFMVWENGRFINPLSVL